MLCGVVKQLAIDTHTQKEISQPTVTFEPSLRSLENGQCLKMFVLLQVSAS